MTNLDLEKRVRGLEKKVQLIEQLLQNKKNIPDSKNGQKKQSIREFLSDKNLNGDTQNTLAIAYFFEIVEGKGIFNADDLKNGFRNAKFRIPSNVNNRIDQNIIQKFIMPVKEKKEGKKAWELTDSGEKEVENNLNKSNEQ